MRGIWDHVPGMGFRAGSQYVREKGEGNNFTPYPYFSVIVTQSFGYAGGGGINGKTNGGPEGGYYRRNASLLLYSYLIITIST